ncbi:hypothetical protein XENTR_v10009309 [Xenopus tropicalis]|uniref:Microtubule-associated tumor suppressor 1 homolog A n=1 Tax=Xenopus tropicalis TaxID=8364 RepID=A0A8J0QKL2_XENTR|eukprot:XP_002932279.1 PREDICTED: microtubule-associated tumor suppressor 1 homolog A-like [Xenopus tropicalis]
MKRSYRKQELADLRATDYTETPKYTSTLQSKAGFVEEQLRRGYQQEAAALDAAMENMTRMYLSRLQALEKELTSTKCELEEAEKQQWEAQKTQSELFHENWRLLKTLQQLRRTMEKQEETKNRRIKNTLK